MNQETLDLFEVHILERSHTVFGYGAKPEVGDADHLPLSHQNGALGRMIQLTDITRPGELDERMTGFVFEANDVLAIVARMLA